MEITKVIKTDCCYLAEFDNSGVLYATGMFDSREYGNCEFACVIPSQAEGMRVAGTLGYTESTFFSELYVGRLEGSDRTAVIPTRNVESDDEGRMLRGWKEMAATMGGTISDKDGKEINVSVDTDLFPKECRRSFERVVLSDGITMIGARTFEGFTNLRRVDLPRSLRLIDELAFADCFALFEIKLNEGLEEIGACALSQSGLDKIRIPRTVKRIGYSAFEECHELSEVTLSKGLEELGANAFLACTSLRQIKLPDTLCVMYGYDEFSPFAYCSKDLVVTYRGVKYRVAEDGARSLNLAVNGRLLSGSLLEDIPDTPAEEFEYDELEDGTLRITAYNGSSRSVRIPEAIDGKTVVTLQEGFLSENGIEVLEFPATWKYVLKGEYYEDFFSSEDKAMLRAIKVDGGVVPGYFLNNCINLREVYLADGIEELYQGTFSYCGRLRHVRLPETLKELVYSELLCGVFAKNNSIKKLVLPSSLKVLDAMALSSDMGGLPNMEYLVLPEGLEEIHDLPFFDVGNLRELNIPSTVKKFSFRDIQGIFDENATRPELKVTYRGKTYETFFYTVNCSTRRNGAFCPTVNLMWSVDEGALWDDMRPYVECELPENWTQEIKAEGEQRTVFFDASDRYPRVLSWVNGELQ